MNSTKFLQTDGRWASLVYPKKPWYIRNCGCGEVSIANILIEMEQYINYTPATIQPYCKQYAAPNGDGTYWSGIPAMMKHYGLTEVMECIKMDTLWKELEKGDRVAVYLMGSRKGGSKGVKWTSSGHFVCSVAYKYENGKHYVYMKDSYSDSALRNGWISYEENMKNDVLKVWVGKLDNKKVDTSLPTGAYVPNGELVVDGIGGADTVKAMQKYFGTTQDGIISGQNKKCSAYYPSIKAVEFVSKNYGSAVVKKLQAWCGVTQDGILGKGTCAAWQYKLRAMGYFKSDEPVDGIFGVKSMKAWQTFLNNGGADISYNTESSAATAPAPQTESNSAKIAKLANEYAYSDNSSKAKYPSGQPKAAYKTALYEAYPNLKGGTSAAAKGASCDVFVGTVIRKAGIDKNYPRGFCPDYTGKSDKFVKVSKNDVRDGDIIFINKANHKHVCIAYGGKVKEASNGDFWPKTTNTLPKRINEATVIYRAK